MRRSLARLGNMLALPLVAVVVVVGLYLFELDVRTYTDLRMGTGLILTGRWVPYVTGLAFIAVAAVAVYVKRTWYVAALGLLALALFGLSLRTLRFDPFTAAVEEHWAVWPVSRDSLAGLNDQGYCYRLEPFTVRFERIGTREAFTYFRGIWPSRFSRQDIDTSRTVEGCST